MVKIPITLYMEGDTLQKLDDYCERRAFSRSSVMRIAIIELLKNRVDK